MVKSKYRYFNGLLFELMGEGGKPAAELAASKMRENGYNARVVQSPKGHGYTVYRSTRKVRRR